MHKLQLTIRAAGAGMLCAVLAATPAMAAPPSLTDQIMVLHKDAADWRKLPAHRLAALPATDAVRTLRGTVQGEIVGGTVRLAPTVELAADTTIVARHLVLIGGALSVKSNGRTLTLLPVDTLRSDAPAGTNGHVQSIITMTANGTPGQDGRLGNQGFWGAAGANGSRGLNGSYFVCDGTSGGDGRPGQRGDRGGDGGPGTNGTGGGGISLSIPDGSTDQYVLVSTGGGGGDGGAGGTGGRGGNGGAGR